MEYYYKGWCDFCYSFFGLVMEKKVSMMARIGFETYFYLYSGMAIGILGNFTWEYLIMLPMMSYLIEITISLVLEIKRKRQQR